MLSKGAAYAVVKQGEYGATLLAVSYTHLFYQTAHTHMGQLEWSDIRGGVSPDKLPHMGVGCLIKFHQIPLIAVSYTHLDVYKRQGMIRPAQGRAVR